MTTAYAWAPITKAEEQDDGTVMVYGPAADAGIDRDKQKLDQAWLDQAMPKWMAEGGPVREQHDPRRAVGVGVGLTRADDGAHLLAARVVDPIAVKKVQTGVLKGFSVGIKDPRIDFGKADAPNGVVVGGDIIEVSVVDRPANPRTLLTLAKADGSGDLSDVEDAELEELEDEDEDGEDTEADEVKADLTQDQRDRMADTGVALPDGSFPIPDEGHLRAAIGRLGTYNGDKTAARRHIVARARALGLTHLLPADWNITKADQIAAEMAPLLPGVAKADAATDIATAHQAIALLAQLIASEAEEMGKGVLSESCDIDCLTDAVKALKYFIAREQTEQDVTVPAPPDGDGDGDGDALDISGGTYMTEPTESKTDAPDLTKTEQAEIIKSYGERIAAVEKSQGERIAALEDKLDKVLALPRAGGPVAMRTASDAAQARAKDTDLLKAQAAEYLAKANECRQTDPDRAAGYMEIRRGLLAKADA